MQFSDNINRINLPGQRIRFKGEVKLTFRDARTGKITRQVGGQNIQTNALDLICGANYNGNINYDELKPLARILCGGILCFQNTLAIDAGNIWPPNDSVNPVVAHAGQTTYAAASTDRTRGLPNDGLTGPTANGYKFVWDFPSTQGNGRISAVALTHKDTGDYWLNNGADYIPVQLLTSASPTTENMPITIIDDVHRTTIQLTGAGTTLTVRKFINNSLLNEMSIAQEPVAVNTSNPNLATVNTYTMPQNAYNMRYLYIKSSQELHCLYFNGTGNNNVKRIIINLITNTATTNDFTLADANLRTYTYSSAIMLVITLDANGYCYAAGNDDKTIYRFLYSDPTQLTSFTVDNAYTYLSNGFIGVGNHALQPNIGVICDKDRAVISGLPYDSRLDGNALRQIMVPINGGPMLWAPYFRVFGGQNSRGGLALCKLYMATVKNLDEPVPKSPTDYMQIEYILTETAEE